MANRRPAKPVLHTAAMDSSTLTQAKTPSLKDFRRIVVKVGSSLLVDLLPAV